jgi:hypothetical protein
MSVVAPSRPESLLGGAGASLALVVFAVNA